MTHPLALAYLRAAAAVERARADHAPTGVKNPAMEMHRARAAWVAAGCPVEVEAADYRNDLVCPGCGGGVAWSESTGRSGATGHARCLSDEIALYNIRPGNPVVFCGWTGRVARRDDGEVDLLTQEPR